jgi:RNA polymerase sigma-70 factor, ECF subfamily
LEDATLLQEIAAGARRAEDELCRKYAPRIRLYGLRHLRDEDGARDLVQAVLLVVLEAARAGRIEQTDKLERFVLGVARNTSLRMRANAARAELRAPEDLPVIAVDAEAAELPSLLRCFEHLEERARSVVQLTFNEERSAEEIAELLAMTPGNVRVVRHRAIAALRSCLETAP